MVLLALFWPFITPPAQVPPESSSAVGGVRAMATLSESQAFLDQFDKCLPLCERGDVVTVVNALHSLNEITQAGLSQAVELDPATGGRDFVCSFVLELELALELFLAQKLGTIDGGLPRLYTYSEHELMMLPEVLSPATKAKVRKFLDALKVQPSAAFETRDVKSAVSEFMAAQVKVAPKPHVPVLKERDIRGVSWADLCSSDSDNESDSDDELPPLEVEDDGEDLIDEAPRDDVAVEREACDGFFGADVAFETAAEERGDEEVIESEDESVASSIFLWAAPVKHAEVNYDDYSPRTAAHRRKEDEAHRSRSLYPFFKTVMCKNFRDKGFCKFGAKCNFAHGESELRKLDEAMGLSLPARPQSPDSETSSQTSSDRRSECSVCIGGASNFKTSMCKNYREKGFCKFGDKCNFAHGKDELRRKDGAGDKKK